MPLPRVQYYLTLLVQNRNTWNMFLLDSNKSKIKSKFKESRCPENVLVVSQMLAVPQVRKPLCLGNCHSASTVIGTPVNYRICRYCEYVICHDST